jgi:uncharacterized repeat protein (TIGR02543 family)
MKKTFTHLSLCILITTLISVSNPATGQIVKEGTLPSIMYNILTDSPTITVYPDFDSDVIKAEDEIFSKENGLPMRAGISIPVEKSINEIGQWQTMPDGRMLWRVTLKTFDASGLGVVFDQFELPEGSELYLFNEGKTMINGALGSHNNNTAQVLSTQVLYGNTISIEYIENPIGFKPEKNSNEQGFISTSDYQSSALLRVGELMFMYQDVYAIFDNSKPNTGGSDFCQIDINCAVGANWQDQKRGVAHTLNKIGNNWYFCSGSLVNNTLEDFTPYFLTAFHCGDGASVADRNLWQFYFNYERPSCGSGTPVTSQVVTGCELRSLAPMAGGSDLLLVELNNQVPLSYNPFYNGWNRLNEGATSGAGIHHPSGDVKKISTFTSTLTSASPVISGSPMATNSAWRVVWSANESGWGVTEGGSSGSPIFNQNGLIVGTLTGGSSFCTNQTAPDFYGKFSYHWESNGSNTNQQLRPWLDPAGTNPTTLRGWDPQWEGGVQPPLSLSATATGIDQIDLLWQKNPDSDDVMLVWAPDNTFGVPQDGTVYSNGQSIPGGGTVLYRGGNTSFSHSGLEAATIYYYRAYSFNASNEYSSGREASATTDCLPLSVLPFSEDFNATTLLPTCWQNVDHQGNAQVWQFGTHANGLTGTTGNYAYLNSDAYGQGNSQNADLVTPLLDLSAYTDVTLSFTHYFLQYQASSTATLSYSLDNGISWTQIQQWTSTTTNPATFSQVIPALDGQSQVRFKWNYTGSWGYYWDVDNVEITGTIEGIFANFTASPLTVMLNETVTFTDASGGGDITSWNWNFGSGANPATANGQGPHEVTYSTLGQKTVSLTVNGDITNTKTNYINVIENPFAPPRQLSALVTNGGNNVELNWLSPELDEGFELYSNFALNFGNWTQYDLDGGATYSISGVTFPNQGYTGSYIIFNPSLANPPLTGAWEAHNGSKYAACFNAVPGSAPNNDWLVSPKISVQNGDVLRFWAKSITAEYGLERFRVGISTTGTEPADFNIISAGTYVEAPVTWTQFSYPLSAYQGQEIHFAIICVSNDAFVFMVDDITVNNAKGEVVFAQDFEKTDDEFLFSRKESENAPEITKSQKSQKSFASYRIYRNGTEIAETSQLTFTDNDLPEGEYTYTVRAVYIDPEGLSDHSNPAQVEITGVTPEYTLTVTINGNGSVEVNGAAYTAPITVDEGTVLGLEALAAAGWQFDGWSGDLVSSNATESIAMDADKNITATFSEIPVDQFTLTVSVVGQGSVEVNGIVYTAPITVDEGTVLSLEALASAGWQFDSWSGDLVSSNANESITMDADKNITATFSEIPIPQFTLTVSVVGQGSVEVNGTAYSAPITVDESTVLSLEAMAAAGWQFDGWSGDLVSSNATESITMDADKNITATFSEIPIPQFTLTVSVVGQGSVEVNGTAYAAPITVDEGTVLSLEALAAAGWQFDGWSGDLVSSNVTESITMDADKNITATFSEIPVDQFTLTVSVVGQGSVEVNGIIYTAPITVDEGTVLSLEALASAGWQFDGWSGDLVSSNANESITMDADKNITANFSEIPIPQFTLTVSVVGQGSVEVNGTAYSAPITVDESTVLSLEALASAGWQFDSWSGDLVSSNATKASPWMQIRISRLLSPKYPYHNLL